MSWSELTIARSDIDALEGRTFDGLNVATGGSALGIAENDDEVLAQAKQELESDIIDQMGDYLNDETYATETALLDAFEDGDDRDLLKDLLVYKFLEVWFAQDASSEETLAWRKAGNYHRKYTNYLRINLQRIAAGMTTPKRVPSYSMGHTYG